MDISQDLFTDTDIINKLFLIQLSPCQNFESINNINTIAVNAFIHQIISANTSIFFLNPKLYNFDILIDMWYNDFEFKWLLIDLSVANRLIGNVS